MSKSWDSDLKSLNKTFEIPVKIQFVIQLDTPGSLFRSGFKGSLNDPKKVTSSKKNCQLSTIFFGHQANLGSHLDTRKFVVGSRQFDIPVPMGSMGRTVYLPT